MPLFLSQRDTESRERMDDPNCDREELFNTYRQFSVINALISRWRTIYKRYIHSYALANDYSCSILDIGFGGGDIPIKLAGWCSSDGIRADITAIETDERAFEYVQKLEQRETVSFQLTSSTNLLREGKSFDFVISNHLLHHLNGDTFYTTLKEAKLLSTHQVLFNDIERSDPGYLLFNLMSRPIFRSSFITSDGLTSIKRSYTRHELSETAPEDWQVKRLFPFRLLLTYHHD